MNIAQKMTALRRMTFNGSWTDGYPSQESLSHPGFQELCARILNETNGTVFTGPFAGMRIPPDSAIGLQPTAIVGCYEKEIHDDINEVICEAPKTLIDIGSAFGYYAVGLARSVYDCRVFAFEAKPEPHWKATRNLAEANGVEDQLDQRGLCTVDELNKCCVDGSFVLCDCEGGEMELLDPQAVPALRNSTMIVELHDFYVRGVTPALIKRFHGSHRISIRCEEPRRPRDYRVLKRLPAEWQRIAVEETRFIDGMITSARFMVLTPRSE
jgi:hypothetical protein